MWVEGNRTHPTTPRGCLTIIIFIDALDTSSCGIGFKQSLAILIKCRARYRVPAISPFELEMGLMYQQASTIVSADSPSHLKSDIFRHEVSLLLKFDLTVNFGLFKAFQYLRATSRRWLSYLLPIPFATTFQL